MSEVSYEVRDKIAHVAIDHGKANTLSTPVIAALGEALTRAEEAGADEVGAMLITGKPGFLSGGFELDEMRASAQSAGTLVTNGGALFTRMFGSPVPVVIACSGHAIAAGALMLLGADERLSAARAREIGLVTEVVPNDELRERAGWAARVIADAPPLAIQGTMRALWTALEVSRQQGIEMANLFTRIGSDPEAFRAGQKRFESGQRVEWRLR